MLLPLETGTIRGQLRDRRTAGKPAVRVGAWYRRAVRGPGKPGNWRSWRGAARQGPLHLIHEGGLVAFCPDGGASARSDTPTSQADHEAERSRLDDTRHSQPRRWVRSA